VALGIRAAGPQDRDAVWSMLEPVFRSGETYAIDPDIGRDQALDYWYTERPFVALDERLPLGTYYLRTNQPGGGSHVCNAGFVTAPDSGGRGVARAMLDHALANARSLGYHAMQFNFVVETNTRAVALWQRAGFATVGRLPRAFRHPVHGYVDALVMYRELTDA